MNYLLIADAYEPATISAAQQLRDLVSCFALDSNSNIIVLIPDVSENSLPSIETKENITLIRSKCMQTKDVNYFRRTIAEFMMPFFLYRTYRKSAYAEYPLHGIIWYSPSIFLGPIVAWLKQRYKCRGYLILRDLFPDWAVDAGVMKKGIAYRILKCVESFQYQQADVIGVQTPANLTHLQAWLSNTRRIEVLQNWLAPEEIKPCSIQIENTILSGRKIFIYSGNMGVAQDMWPILHAVQELQNNVQWGFLFVGRGSEAQAIKQFICNENLNNALILNEIQPDEIPGLFQQCDIGLVALDPRHTTHNIPGKFIAYTRSGLPVLARINQGNDLLQIINDGQIGIAVNNSSIDSFIDATKSIMQLSESQLLKYKENARNQWASHYSVQSVVSQIKQALKA